MPEIKLKPCPFCGRKAWTFHVPEKSDNEYKNILNELIRRAPGRWLVGCDTRLCMLNINNMPETFASEQEAAEAWNKRAEPELPSAQPEIVRCKDCAAYGEMLTGRDTRMICHKFALNFPQDFYCAYAERRTDE